MIDTAPDTRLRDRRILVAEDEPLLAMEIIDDLEQIGAITVGPAPSVASALSYIGGEQLDAALLNVNLRGEVSTSVANLLTERGIPFLFVTGNDDFVREHFPQIPAHPKPCDMPLLIRALGDLLDRSNGSPPASVVAASAD